MATVSVDEAESIATISFGSGGRLNALGERDWEDLRCAVHGLASDPTLRAVVVRGRGGVFCAGSDIREWDGTSGADVGRTFDVLEAALQALEDLPVPTLAVVEGVAAGGGCQLAPCLRPAAPDPHSTDGDACGTPGLAGSAHLRRPLGTTGRSVPGQGPSLHGPHADGAPGVGHGAGHHPGPGRQRRRCARCGPRPVEGSLSGFLEGIESGGG